MSPENDTANPVPDPAARLQAAAAHLRRLLAAIATESPADLPLHADGRTVTQGRVGLHDFATAATPEVAAFITAVGPLAGEAIVTVLDQAAAGYRPGAMGNGMVICPDCCETVPCSHIKPALALADAILAGAEGER